MVVSQSRWISYMLNELFIDENAEHFRCPDCDAVVFHLTADYILVMTVAEVKEIDEDRLPPDFDPGSLSQKQCPACNPKKWGYPLPEDHLEVRREASV